MVLCKPRVSNFLWFVMIMSGTVDFSEIGTNEKVISKSISQLFMPNNAIAVVTKN